MGRAIRYSGETEEQETARKKNELKRFLANVFTNGGVGFGVVTVLDIQKHLPHLPAGDLVWLLLSVGTIFLSYLILRGIEPEF